MHVPRLALVVPPLAVAACIYDGEYLLRGTVRAQRPDGVAIVEDASVVLTTEQRHGRGPVWVGRDGTFEARYRFGGMGFLLFGPGDGNPHLEFSAPGYRVLRVKVRSDDVVNGVTRRPCAPPGPRGMYCFDVVLTPESPGSGDRVR